MELFDRQARPLPAEALIVEAVSRYQNVGDQRGLADAYRTYGLFFRSRTLALANYAAHYRAKGFLDQAATYDGRYVRALYYLHLAEGILVTIDAADLLSNVYFHIGDVSVLSGDNSAACHYYAMSAKSQGEFRVTHPGRLSAGELANFDTAIASAQSHAGC